MEIKKKVGLVAKGFCMGTADVIPGVSGGTMAFILGIYTELIESIKSFDFAWLKSVLTFDLSNTLYRPKFGFLLPLGIGICLALLFFTRIVKLPVLLQIYPEIIYGLFFGLITGSIVALVLGMHSIKLKDVIYIIIGFIPGLIIFNAVPVHTPDTFWFTFLSGGLAICAMILPGISGSFILLILKKYTYIFNAIGYFKITILVPFVLGALTGLIVFSRILSFLLDKYHRHTILFITGLLLASLWVIWPFQNPVYETINGNQVLMGSTPFFPLRISSTVLFSAAMTVAGFFIIIILNKIAIVKVES